MTSASYQSEDCLYNYRVIFCRDCADCSLCYKSELLYECLDCINCYNCNYSIYCEQAIDCDWCYFCVGTKNCFGCVGLRQKSFHIFNQPYSKEEYQARLAELQKMPCEKIMAELEPLLTSVPRVAMYGKNNEGSAGENIHNCKNVYWAFDSKNLWDCFYIYHGDDLKNCLDISHLGWAEDCFEIMSGVTLTSCMFCSGCWNSNNLTYCELIYNSRDCFGCVSRNHTEYEILNVKYSKEEYSKKVEEIKEGMKKDGSFGKWFSSTYPEVITYGL